MIELKDILEKIFLQDDKFKRRTFAEGSWSMDTMLEAVKEIGRSYEPRFVLDNDNLSTYRNLIYWLMCDSRMTAIDPRDGREIKGRLAKGIYIAGNTGSGKSLAMNILKSLYRLNPIYTPEKVALKWESGRADEITDYFLSSGELESYKKAPLLCIQDLGSEPNETLYMGNRVKVLQSIIEYRGDIRTVTMVTSNIPMGHSDLKARYGERATSRMMEMMNYLVLTGKDRRQNF